MSRLTVAVSVAAVLCVTGQFVEPVSAQCAVISADPACARAVRPSVRVDFSVTRPDGLSDRSRVRSLVDRWSVRVPLLIRELSRECEDHERDDRAEPPARPHQARRPDWSHSYPLDESDVGRRRTGCLSSHPRARVFLASGPSGER
jgi:hypothetical protein